METAIISDHGESVSALLIKREMVFDRVRYFISQWIKRQGIYFYDVFCDQELLSEDDNRFRCTIRVIDRYQRRAHLFRLRFRDDRFEFEYGKMSQNPSDFLPGVTLMGLEERAGSFS